MTYKRLRKYNVDDNNINKNNDNNNIENNNMLLSGLSSLLNDQNSAIFYALMNSGLNKLYSESESDENSNDNNNNNTNNIFIVDDIIISKSNFKGIRYKVNTDKFEVYVLTANSKGETKENLVTEYTIHFNLKGYKFKLKEEYKHIYKSKANFDFIVSDDHSLLVYNIKTKSILKMKPEIVIRKKNDYGLIVLKNHFEENNNIIGDINDKIGYLPVTCLDYEKVKNMTMYDLSFEDTNYDNFFLSNGVCVVDTVVVYALHSEEAKQEALEKMTPSKQYVDPFKSNSFIFDVDKNIVFGLVYGTKDPKELKLSYQPKTIKLDKSYTDYNELLKDLKEKHEGFSIYDYVIVDKNKYTIGQYMIQLAINKHLSKNTKQKK